jgi:hypothetical protein
VHFTRARVACLAVLASLCGAPPASAQEPVSEPVPTFEAVLIAAEEQRLARELRRFRKETNRLRLLMGKRRARLTSDPAAFATALDQLRFLRNAWRAELLRTKRRFQRPPHVAAWRCIHRYEGPWNDPNAPYFGGLQMDLTFQRRYGRSLLRQKGTANRWTRWEQMWVAERAYRSGRGFFPWPNTARYCGLI